MPCHRVCVRVCVREHWRTDGHERLPQTSQALPLYHSRRLRLPVLLRLRRQGGVVLPLRFSGRRPFLTTNETVRAHIIGKRTRITCFQTRLVPVADRTESE